MKNHPTTQSFGLSDSIPGWLQTSAANPGEEKQNRESLASMVGWLRLYQHIMRKPRRSSRSKP